MNKTKIWGILCVFGISLLAGLAPAQNDAIREAILSGDLARVKAIVENDPSVIHAKNRAGLTPLFDAVLENRPEIAEFLISRGADVNARNNFQVTPLHLACGNALPLGIIRLLVEKGADVNAVAKYVGKPLDLAYESGDEESIAYLVSAGATATPLQFETFRLTGSLRRIAFPWGMRNNIVIQHGPDGILLVDTGFSKRAAEAIRKTIAGFAKGDIRWVVNTHAHMDHVAGNGLAPSDASVIGYQGLTHGDFNNIVKKQEAPLAGRAGRTLAAPYILRFNGEDIALIPNPGLHSQDDILIHFPRAGYVAMGDLLLSQNCPAVRDPDKYLDFLDSVLDVFPPRTVFISGHGKDLTYEGLRKYRGAIAAMTAVVRKGAADGKNAVDMIKDDILRPYKAEYSFLDWLGPDAWIARVAGSLKGTQEKP
jgi:glyoxylase-like metal-dependent hydrolase (beta-lactamase superfamily II)